MKLWNQRCKGCVLALLLLTFVLLPFSVTAIGTRGSFESDLVSERELSELDELLADNEFFDRTFLQLPEFSDQLECADELNAEIDAIMERVLASIEVDLESEYQITSSYFEVYASDDILCCHTGVQLTDGDGNPPFVDHIAVIDLDTGERLHDDELLEKLGVDPDKELAIIEKNLLEQNPKDGGFVNMDIRHLEMLMLNFWDGYEDFGDRFYFNPGGELRMLIERCASDDYCFQDEMPLKLYNLPDEELLNPFYVMVCNILELDPADQDILVAYLGEADDEPSIQALIEKLPQPDTWVYTYWARSNFDYLSRTRFTDDEIRMPAGTDFMIVIPRLSSMLCGMEPEDEWAQATLLPGNLLINYDAAQGATFQVAYRGAPVAYELEGNADGLTLKSKSKRADTEILDITDRLDEIPERGYGDAELFDAIYHFFPKG